MSVAAYAAVVKKNRKFFITLMWAWFAFFLVYAKVKHLFFLSNDQQQELSNTLANMPVMVIVLLTPKLLGLAIMCHIGKIWFKSDMENDENQGLDFIEIFSTNINKIAKAWHLVIIPAILLCLSSFFRDNLLLLSLFVSLGFTFAMSFLYILQDATTREKALFLVIYNLSLIPYYFYIP